MKLIQKIKSFLLYDTFGAIASASFIICAISGVVLAIPYDVADPFESISTILIANPAALFFRNIHYWSAQFFLVFTILHLWDHLKLETEQEQSKGIWFRLSISILVLFFVMITGFILKADADSLQARRIITELITKIPLIGNFLSFGFFGADGDFQIIYVHHIATASIFLAVIIWEHAKTLWTKLSTFLISLSILSVISFLLHAPLHNGLSPIIKGPWYFIGLQEILHWISSPGFVLLFILLIIALFYSLIIFKTESGKYIKKCLFYLFYIYIILTVIAYFFRGENWSWTTPWQKKFISGDPFRTGLDFPNENIAEYSKFDIPQVGDRKEGCLICHKEMKGFAPSHDPNAIGCSSCHLGDPFTINKSRAHRNMVLIPGNLDNAKQTCGSIDCHPQIIPRLNNSLMTTNSGIVSVDRFVFGESSLLNTHSHIKDLEYSAADKHMRDLCANCHLGNAKLETGPVDQMSRGGGCNACHLNYSEINKQQHLAYLDGDRKKEFLPELHPSLVINVSNDHCFGCHSRSGRISTNYEGWHETLFDENEVHNNRNYRILQDKRVFEFVQADIHHQKGMDCIDCHSSYEVMGDGKQYFHEEQAVKISCEDCHSETFQSTITYSELDLESKLIFDLRNFPHSDKQMILGSKSDIALINTYVNGNKAFMIGKISNTIHPLNPPSNICKKDEVHESLSCSSCHTAWAPQCIGCHNEFDKSSQGYDLLDNKFITGEWVEYVGQFMAEPPTLGVRVGETNKIEPAVPGMIMTIDKSNYQSSNDSLIFHRLFAPVAPHTTGKSGRKCKSCHNDPVALGYGRGNLIFETLNNKGRWKFNPTYTKTKHDGLPEDAWIGFLMEPNGVNSTRSDFRPFTILEQQKILTVGACLCCHDENSQIILNSLDMKFVDYLQKKSAECILPEWD